MSLTLALLTLAVLLPGSMHAMFLQDSLRQASDTALEPTEQENANRAERATPFALLELPADLRRWLDEVEALNEPGDLEGAEQHLSGLIASDTYAGLLSGADATALAGLAAIIAVAEDLSLLEIEGVVREEQVRRLSATLDVDHPDLLSAMGSLAATRYGLGDLAGTRELEEQVHAARERLLPPDHPDLLMAKEDLALTRYDLGDLAGALELYEYVHEARERLQSPDHPDLLVVKQNLAATRSALGDVAGGLELEEYVHAARERLLPPDHPDLLVAKQNLALSRYELGDFTGTLELEEQVHAAYARLFPADHPDLLRAKKELALTRAKLGDVAGALELEEQLHAARERQLSPDHPDLLNAKMNLAVKRAQSGDLAGALELFELVHTAHQRLLPPDHPDLLNAKMNLAATRGGLGNIAGAWELEEHVVAARKRLLPPDHPDLLRATGNLAITRGRLGDLGGARELEEQVHEAWERLLPSDHPDLLSAKENLAVTRGRLGDLAGALELEEQVFSARERLLPPDHPDLLRSKQNLAVTRSERGDFAGALELEEQVHEARMRLLPSDHLDLLAAKQNLAGTRSKLEDFKGALELSEQVHSALERLLPPDHSDLLESMQSLAATRSELGDIAGALELFERVLAARERLLPPDHPDLLRSRVNLALSRAELSDFAGALELVKTTLEGQNIVARALRGEAPREARAAAEIELHQLAKCLFVSESGRSKKTLSGPLTVESMLFATLESLRSVSIGSPAVMSAATKRPELERLLAERRRVRGALGDLQLGAPTDAEDSEVNAWRSELVKLSEERDSIERDVRRGLGELGFEEAMPTAPAVAAGLGANALLVDFFRYERIGSVDPENEQRAPIVDSLLAFVVTPASDVYRVELGASADVEQLVAEWNGRIGRSVGRGVGVVEEGRSDAEVAMRLRERLLDPCLAVVGGELPEQLHVILDDFLYLLPFDALIWKNGKRLGEVCEVRSEVTAQRLTTNAGPYSGNGKLLALGGVDFSAKDVEVPQGLLASATPPMGDSYRSNSSRPGDFGGLGHSRIEIEALESMFEDMMEGGSVVLTGAKASKTALFEGAASARYLHLATHGWFAPETFASTRDRQAERGGALLSSIRRAEETVRGYAPETLCGLALAGANEGLNSIGKVPGIITAEELSALDLGNCELAVLSACETNVGIRRAGQGIQSLQTALHAAGVRTAITTLWRVDDGAARRLMELFYTKLWRDEMPKAKALWQAKMEMRAEGFAVKDWAGWVMTGDPR